SSPSPAPWIRSPRVTRARSPRVRSATSESSSRRARAASCPSRSSNSRSQRTRSAYASTGRHCASVDGMVCCHSSANIIKQHQTDVFGRNRGGAMRDHRPDQRRDVGRAALLVLSLTGGSVLTASTALGAWRLLPGSLDPGAAPAQLLVAAAAALAALASGWLTLTMLLAAAARLPGSVGERCTGLRDRYAPAVVQRWAALVLGASATAVVLPGTAA